MRFNFDNRLFGQRGPTLIILLGIIMILFFMFTLIVESSSQVLNPISIIGKEKIVIVITGANGLLGAITTQALKDPKVEEEMVNLPIEVVGIDLPETQFKPSPRMLMDGLSTRPYEFKNLMQKPYSADVTKMRQLRSVFQQIEKELGQIDVVIHFAGVLENQPPKSIEKVNVAGTKNLYQVCTDMGIKKIVLASSVTVAYDLFFKKEIKEIQPEARRMEDVDWEVIQNSLPDYSPKIPFKSLETYIRSKIKNESEADKRVRENRIKTVIARIGWVNSNNAVKSLAESGEFCSYADFIRFIIASLKYLLGETDINKFKNPILYVVSRGTKYSPRNQMGFAPQDQAEDFIKTIDHKET